MIYNTILSISSTPISPKDVPHRLLLLPPQSRYLTCHLQHLSTLLLSLKVPLEEPAKLLSHLFDLVFPPFFLVTVVEFGEVAGEGVECAKDESSGDVRVLDDAEASDVAVEGDGLQQAVEEVQLHGMAEVGEAELAVALVVLPHPLPLPLALRLLELLHLLALHRLVEHLPIGPEGRQVRADNLGGLLLEVPVDDLHLQTGCFWETLPPGNEGGVVFSLLQDVGLEDEEVLPHVELGLLLQQTPNVLVVDLALDAALASLQQLQHPRYPTALYPYRIHLPYGPFGEEELIECFELFGKLVVYVLRVEGGIDGLGVFEGGDKSLGLLEVELLFVLEYLPSVLVGGLEGVLEERGDFLELLLPQLPLKSTHLYLFTIITVIPQFTTYNNCIALLREISPLRQYHPLWDLLSMLQYGLVIFLFLQVIDSNPYYNRFLSKYTSGIMPPKKSTRSSAPKTEDKEDKPIQKDEEPKTRTRGRQLDKSASKDAEPAKKIKLDDDEGDKKAKTQPKKTRSKDLSASKKKDEPEDKPLPAKQPAKEPAKQDLKKVILKGNIPVDQYFPNQDNYKVYSQGGINYAKTLNQSNLQNNNNKFYILQILQNQTDNTFNPNNFMFFTRWGRVGVEGQHAIIPCYSPDIAIREFNKKLRDKLNGGYREVEMNYDDDKKQDAKEVKESAKGTKGGQQQPQVQSNLDKSVQDLVRLIFDMKMMNNQMKEIGYDAQKMPLGKLAKNSILRGYQALKGLMEEVKGKKRHDVLSRLSSDFYSEIPHDFGFQKMQHFILDTEQKIKQKLEMLQSLQDIQVFTKLLDEGKISSDMNELDSNYLKLNTNITPLDKSSDTYKLLLQYVENTHASTHTAYKLEVEEIFELSKDSENSRFRKDISNKQLLWHGSRLTNFVGILSQGLRIAPPEAPVTGYMFGKGVYFADMVTKSANYCFTNSTNNTGLMLLCEVALGDVNEKMYADYYANLLPPGKFSTKGVGRTAPDGGKHLGEVFVPCGRGKDVGVAGTSLLYNEFIVYDIAQIKSRYLFRMKFNYNYRR